MTQTVKHLFSGVWLYAASALLITAHAAPDIKTWHTDNGARVLYVHAPEIPMLDVRVVFDGGSARDGDKPGVAFVTNALLDQGAGELDENQIAERLESLGARLSNSSHRDMAVVSLRSLTDESLLQPALDTMATILSQPAFPEHALERDRKRLLIALQGQKQSPRDIASLAFFDGLYSGHPYAHQPMGSEVSIQAIGRDDLIAHHKRYYVGRNATVAIVGALSQAQAEALAQQVVGALPAGQKAAALPGVSPLSAAQTVAKVFPSSQTHIMMGQPGMHRGDPDYFPLYVGNHVLGGSGLVSRLSEEIREKRGLSYSAYSSLSPMRQNGPFVMGLQTRNDQAEEALTVMNTVLENFIANGPSDDELSEAKKNITGGFALRLDSNKKIVDYIAMIGFYGLPLDYLETFKDKVNAVTQAQIKDAFKRRLKPASMVTVIVGGEDDPA